MESRRRPPTVLITSYERNTRAVDHLLQSLRAVPEYDDLDIILVIGGASSCDDEYEMRRDGNMTTVRVTHNSMDFTGLIAALEIPELRRDRYFYIHDTTRVGPGLYTKLMSLPGDCETACFAFPSMNMGLYSWTALEHYRDLIMSYKTTEESTEVIQRLKHRCVDTEDAIFRNQITQGRYHVFLSRVPAPPSAPQDYYETGVPRVILQFPEIDMIKIKANWYGKSEYELGL